VHTEAFSVSTPQQRDIPFSDKLSANANTFTARPVPSLRLSRARRRPRARVESSSPAPFTRALGGSPSAVLLCWPGLGGMCPRVRSEASPL
jgi:hypothetical protein